MFCLRKGAIYGATNCTLRSWWLCFFFLWQLAGDRRVPCLAKDLEVFVETRLFFSFAQKGCWILFCFRNISQACYGHLWTPLATTDQRKFSTLAVSPKMAARSNRLAALLLQRVRPARLLTCTRICRSTISSGAETHGGDDIHKVDRLVCDFSVTTNALGPVPKALEAVQQLLAGQENLEALKDWNPSQNVTSAPAVEHYPQRSDLQLEEVVATFLRGNDGKSQAQQQLIFGNGASELIDLLARAAPSGKYCLNPATEVQYREYQRACTNAGRERTEKPQEASIICLVNPNNPTGDFLEREEMESWITANAAPGSWVLVDESMLFWAGPDFQERGVSSKFVESMVKKHINIFLVQSWTKIFACTGLRIGTVLCPTQEKRDHLLSLQVPWSVTIFARAYLKAAILDPSYLERTWEETPAWRSHMVARLQRLHPTWKFLGKPWLSWIWIDTGCPEVAKDVYRTALNCGCPIRHAASGYDRPSVVRLAVRRPYDFSVLYQALLRRENNSAAMMQTTFGTSADVNPDVIDGVRLVHIDDLHPHEEVLTDRADKLKNYVRDLPVKILPAIIIDSRYLDLFVWVIFYFVPWDSSPSNQHFRENIYIYVLELFLTASVAVPCKPPRLWRCHWWPPSFGVIQVSWIDNRSSCLSELWTSRYFGESSRSATRCV